MKTDYYQPDPKLDLVLDRVIDVPPSLVWEVWTKPEHLNKWFVPAPWSVKDCEIDLCPGGAFKSTMISPEGQEFPNVGCLLEVVPEKKLVFTDTMLPGFRPSANPFFTAILTLEPRGKGTRYHVLARHKDEAGRKQHEEMGFHHGWGKALDQLVAHAKTLR